MRKYKIIYTSKIDGDCCTIWIQARSAQEAKDEAKFEYWDIKEIIECYEFF